MRDMMYNRLKLFCVCVRARKRDDRRQQGLIPRALKRLRSRTSILPIKVPTRKISCTLESLLRDCSVLASKSSCKLSSHLPSDLDSTLCHIRITMHFVTAFFLTSSFVCVFQESKHMDAHLLFHRVTALFTLASIDFGSLTNSIHLPSAAAVSLLFQCKNNVLVLLFT